MSQHPARDTRRADGRGYQVKSIAVLILLGLVALGCVHKAPGLPKGHQAPAINTDRPGTLSR